MSFEKFLFYVFGLILIGAASMVITRKNPVQAAMFLILSFVSCSALWLLLEAEFLAIVLVLVYVGAVMVLFLFVIMMLDINTAIVKSRFMNHLPLGALLFFTMLIEMILVMTNQYFRSPHFTAPVPKIASYSNTEALGKVLYTEYMYPFEIAAVILVIGIIAAIGLTLRKRTDTKKQEPAQQILATKANRLKIIKIDAEERLEVK